MEKLNQFQENKKPIPPVNELKKEGEASKKKKESVVEGQIRLVDDTRSQGGNNPAIEKRSSSEGKKVTESIKQNIDKENNELVNKAKKKQSDLTEVLANRSWVTNFYHNYTKAIERANLEPAIPKQIVGKPIDKGQAPIITKAVESPFKSILFVKPEKHQPSLLRSAKPDIAVIAAFKQIINEEKSKEKDLQRSLAHFGTKQKMETAQSGKSDQSINVKNTGKIDVPAKEIKPVYTLKEVPIKQFEKLGVTQDQLEKSGVLDKLLKGDKTAPIANIQLANRKGGAVAYSASFQLERKSNGSIALKVHPVANKPEMKIPDKIAGRDISTEMKKELQEKKAVALSKNSLSGKILSLLVLDLVKKSIKVVTPTKLKVPQEIKGVKLTQEQQTSLQEGKSVKLRGLTSKDNKTKFDATVNIDVSKNTLKFSNALPSTAGKESKSIKDRNSISKAETKGLESSNLNKTAESNKVNVKKAEETTKQKPRGMKM